MHGATGITWETFVFLPIFLGALAYAAYRLLILWRLLKAHKGKDARFGEIGGRLQAVVVNVLGQKAVLRKKSAGIMHAMIFWGFILISVGTLEQFISTIYGGANFEFIGQAPYSALVFLMDLLVIAVLLAVFYAAYRRLIVRPPHLGQSKDANYILLFTGLLMASILGMNAFLILGHDPWFASSMPFSLGLASVASILNLTPESYAALGTSFKWIHMLIVLGFAVYIPGSKHLHIVAAGPNTFFKNLDWQRAMKSINFEDESIEQYGAGKITDLSWKDALDYYSCTECGRCQELCPAWNTEKPLSPKNIIRDLKMNLLKHQAKALAGDYDGIGHVVDENVTEDVIWACTSCRACETACPVFISQTDKIYDIRRNLVMMESRFPQEVQTVFKNMETNATPWAFSADDRDKWAEGMGVKTMAEDQNVDVLLWVGCAGSYDDRNKKVVRSFSSLLKKAGVKFAILGKEEKCTGDPARRIGNEYLFQTLAKENVEVLNKYQPKKVLTTCPHCFNCLKNEYPDFGGNYQVQHHAEYLAEAVKTGKLKPSKSVDEVITYHDSCYLGRWNGRFKEPREVLGAIPGAQTVEMSANNEKSMCCGAGGGRMWMEETIGKRVNVTRTEQALETNADVIAANCPFCMTMMTDGVKTKGMQEKVKVQDIAEILDEATT